MWSVSARGALAPIKIRGAEGTLHATRCSRLIRSFHFVPSAVRLGVYSSAVEEFETPQETADQVGDY